MLKIFEMDVKFDPNKIYVVYPLHFYPEASTSIFAKYYDGNEYNIIKNIAFSLPENAVLVVKEHKSNVGNNTKEFYKKIKQLPNVILLTPYYSLKDNLPQFDAVVTISSTVGFEALTLDIPTYALGEIFYQHYPGCNKITSYADMDEKLNKLEKKKVSGTKNQTFNLYSKMCYKGSFNYMDANCLNETNVQLLAKPLADYLNTGKLTKHRNDIA
jgi:CDP-glycerol glycerophosphotransferase (TagB/SpsB family)